MFYLGLFFKFFCNLWSPLAILSHNFNLENSTSSVLMPSVSILAIFGPLRPYLNHSGSGKQSKLVSLKVLSNVPTLFQYSFNKLLVLIVKIIIQSIFFVVFFGSLRAKHVECCDIQLLAEVSAQIGSRKNIDVRNGALFKKAYHKSHCRSPQISECPKKDFPLLNIWEVYI